MRCPWTQWLLTAIQPFTVITTARRGKAPPLMRRDEKSSGPGARSRGDPGG